ncbi:MAG TPA: hypothetical protein VFR97_00050 [Capillimicrobium sp.]|nr:hypothetical protein [Capillimicrobium sp.]
MRRGSVALVVLSVAALAACGAEEPRASTWAPDDPVTAPAQPSAPVAADPAACRRVSRRLPGLRVRRAEARAEQAGCAFRVVRRNGTDLPVTEDFSPSRINVAVRSGVVTRVVGLF